VGILGPSSRDTMLIRLTRRHQADPKKSEASPGETEPRAASPQKKGVVSVYTETLYYKRY